MIRKRNMSKESNTLWARLKRQCARIQLYHAVEAGLKRQEFQIYYQPQYHLASRETAGAEALVRWCRPNGQMVLPDTFIPCLETSGRIAGLDAYVIRRVCHYLGDLKKQGVKAPPVSINLSRFHLKHPEIVGVIEEALEQHHLDPDSLSFEITESLFYNHVSQLQYLVDSLHGIGCRVEMDDYGMGIANLYTLSQVAFDTLKIDRKYIQQIGNPRGEEIIRSILELADRLRLDVVAEGIETAAQEAFLQAHNCRTGQGYYYARPVSEAAFRAMLIQQAQEKGRFQTPHAKSI